MSIEQNKQIALRFANDGWGTMSNWQAVWDELFSADIVYHFNSRPEAIVGLEANKEFNASLFIGFPDIQQTIEHMISEGDLVVYRSCLVGTHTGNFLELPPTNKSIQISDFTMLRIENNKIVELWYDCNLLAMMEQLGLA